MGGDLRAVAASACLYYVAWKVMPDAHPTTPEEQLQVLVAGVVFVAANVMLGLWFCKTETDGDLGALLLTDPVAPMEGQPSLHPVTSTARKFTVQTLHRAAPSRLTMSTTNDHPPKYLHGFQNPRFQRSTRREGAPTIERPHTRSPVRAQQPRTITEWPGRSSPVEEVFDPLNFPGAVDLENILFDPSQGPRLPKNHKGPDEYHLNRGRVIAALQDDYPNLMHTPPDLSMWLPGIELHDPTGLRLTGISQYQRMFKGMRLLLNIPGTTSQITYRMYPDGLGPGPGEIKMRFCCKIWMQDPLVGMNPMSDGPPLFFQIDGVSKYELNSLGYVTRHTLDNTIISGPDQAPIHFRFGWHPTFGRVMPPPVVAGGTNHFFRAMAIVMRLLEKLDKKDDYRDGGMAV